MPSALDIRRRIRSVKSTLQITKAMKMVSAAKLRRAQDRALSARPYEQMLANVLKSLVNRAEVFDPETGEPRHPLLAQREEKNILLIVITGDKGLAGAFNTNINKATVQLLERRPDQNIDIICVGRKGRDFLRRRFPTGKAGEERAGRIQIVDERVNILGKISFADASELAENVISRFTAGEVDSVYLLFNEFKSVISQRLVLDVVLPMREVGVHDVATLLEQSVEEREKQVLAAEAAGVSAHGTETSEIDRRAAEFGTAQVDYIYEQTPDELFRALLPKYVGAEVYRSMIESWAAFNAAQMTAMDAATSNASDMIDRLTLAMNRVRQAKITKEIIEIVSGAAAQ